MFFDQITAGAPDPVFGWLSAYKNDSRLQKINLIVGSYKNDALQSPVLPSVQKAQATVGIVADYLPIDGLEEFYEQIGHLCFGSVLWNRARERIYAGQAVGGTGALRVGAEFLKQELGSHFALPSPTWPTHHSLTMRVGGMVHVLPYYNHSLHGIDRAAYFQALEKLPAKTTVLFHACCHNPTGCDLPLAVWKEISDLCKAKQLFPFFDFAYQGFGDGIDEDAAAVRLFLEQEHEMLVAYSCSKNFSLYSERVGALFIVSSNSQMKQNIGSQVRRIMRNLYSNPPAHGAKIATAILTNKELTCMWRADLANMRSTIEHKRRNLAEALHRHSQKNDFRFILDHKGMFSYLDLTAEQVAKLITEYGIYTLDSGRINIAGLNSDNFEYFIRAITEVCEL